MCVTKNIKVTDATPWSTTIKKQTCLLLILLDFSRSRQEIKYIKAYNIVLLDI